jgi:transcription elongation factor Elf1
MRLTGRRRKIFDNRMSIAKVDTADDVLSCPKCGAKAMEIYIEENEVQSVKCANCKVLVAYTEKLIRVL